LRRAPPTELLSSALFCTAFSDRIFYISLSTSATFLKSTSGFIL